MASTTELVTDSTAKENEKQFWEMKFPDKVSYIREIVTVEPLIGAYVMASTLCGPTLYNLEFEKSCRVNLEFNDTVCEAILAGTHENYTEQNVEVQILISNMHSWQQPIQSIMPLILVLFIGSFSDRHKWRKPFLLMPIFGEFFAVAGCILCIVFMRSWPLEVQGVLQTIVPSFFGGQTMIVMSVYAYIADVSSVQMRTLRIGVVQIVLNIIVPLTQLFSANLFELAGYYVVLLLAGGLYVFAFLYGIFWIKEPKQPIKKSDKNILHDIFDPRHAVETFNLLLKKSPTNNRLYIFLVLMTLFVYTAVVVGETSVFFLYAQNQFEWTIVEYSYFITFNTLVHLVGTAVAVPIFTNVLHLTDMTILLVTFLDKIITNVLFGLTGMFSTNILLYAAATVSIITGVTAIGMRSLATKIVSEDDMGKAQSLFGICEAIAPSLAIPLYNKGIYNNTLTSFPSAFFVLGIILYAICSIIITWMHYREKGKIKSSSDQEQTNGTSEKQYPLENLDNIQSTYM